jgi:hypothetical protein
MILLIAWLIFSTFFVLWLIRKKPFRRNRRPDPNLLDEDVKTKRRNS